MPKLCLRRFGALERNDLLLAAEKDGPAEPFDREPVLRLANLWAAFDVKRLAAPRAQTIPTTVKGLWPLCAYYAPLAYERVNGAQPCAATR